MWRFSSFPITHWAEFYSAQAVAIRWEKSSEPAMLPAIPAEISWSQLHHFLTQFAARLQQLGAKSQSVIAYCGSHKLISLLCYCAAIALGCRILMLNPALTAAQRAQILADNRVDLLVGDLDFAHFHQNSPGCLTTFDPNAPATLTLTSGSSGKPKAVVHSVANHLANAEGVCELMQFGAAHSWLLSLPLFHVSGQGIVWRWLLQGATLHINENKATFWQSLQAVSHASLVPTQLQRYLHWLGENQHAQQHLLLGGAQIPPTLVIRAQQQGITTYSGYGMTEMASTICAVKNGSASVGTPLAGREVKLEQGEIWVKGAMLALGYWREGKIVPIGDTQGWFATKDCGEWNRQGELLVNGRKDNMFISGGENIQPEEIERVLMRSGLLKNVLVVPVSSQEFGARPVAFVECLGEYAMTVPELQRFAAQQLEKFKWPVAYLPFESEKWQANGIKISRTALADFAAQQNIGEINHYV